MKKKVQKENRYGCEARPASPSAQGNGNDQAERGITQNESNAYAADEQREKAGGYCGDDAYIREHSGNEQHGCYVAHCHERL
jgi:hypothetical protein